MSFMGFSDEEIKRYSRQIILPEVGGKGQRKLMRSSVLCIGAGGLGSSVLLYLAAAGVGRIGIVDADVVDISNLQRQVVHSNSDIGVDKTESARKKLLSINPNIEVRAYNTYLTPDNAEEIIKDYDIVVDGTDNFPTRYLVNDACVLLEKPLFHGSIYKFEGYITTFLPRKGPCYRCLFKKAPPAGMVPSCLEVGVLGVLPGVVGTIQATEVLKYLLNIGDLLVGRLLVYDAMGMSFDTFEYEKNPNCPVCGTNPTILNLKTEEYGEICEEH